MRSSVTLRRGCWSTTTPRRTIRPARRASAVDGRPPAVRTTRSVGQDVAVVELHPSLGQPDGAGAGVDVGAEPAQVAGEDGPRPEPTWLASRWSAPSTTSVSSPRTASARATWRPSRPPPTTTARGSRRSLLDQRASPRRRAGGSRRGCGTAWTFGCEGAVAADQAADRRQGGDRCRSRGRAGRRPPVARRRARPRVPRGRSRARGRRGAGRSRARRVPRRRTEGQRVGGVGPLEHRRQQDAVVGRVRLVGEHGDGGPIGADELLGQARRRPSRRRPPRRARQHDVVDRREAPRTP